MTGLKLYDTLSREKRDFVPRDPSRVTMYVCGPTVYNHAHIGNARPAVVFDVLFRLLRRLYGEDAVVYARNITDVEDKINAKAQAEGVPITTITDRYTAIYHADMAALGNLPPSKEPRATAHMAQMIGLMEKLVANGCAYAAEGHVLFDTEAYGRYGALSGRSLDDMIAGARVEVAPYKKNPADFVMWKPSKPGEPSWDSPWGPGRPGWHIECSAMVEEQLGLPIDIHGGGIDLQFPHHENEIAQSVCAHHHGDAAQPESYARYWMHNGFLDMSGEKMSKSLGNVQLISDLADRWPGEVLRWALLSAHYRAPLDWTESLLEQSRASLDRLYGVLRRAKHIEAWDEPDDEFTFAELNDDLNTPSAFSRLFATSRELDGFLSPTGGATEAAAGHAKGRLLRDAKVLGLLQQDPEAWFKAGADDDLTAKVEALLAERVTARAARDWPTADRIRADLDALGVVVMDGPTGATWRMKAEG